MNTVIMVEKDSKLIINYKRMLEPYQKEIKFIYFMYPEEALEYIAQNSVSVLLSELDLPVMSGKELFDMVEMVSPTTIKIAMSQVIEVEKTLEIMNQSRIFKLILKPFFLVEDLLTPIQEAIKYYEHQEVEECYRRNVSLELEMLNKKSEELNQKLEEKKQSYTSVYDMAVGIVRTNLKYGKVPFTEEEESLVNKVFEGLFQEFMRYYMFEARNFIFHANYLKNMFHHPKEAQNFIIKSNTEKEIECK
ncbi:MAG: response regulator, partial [Lachnospiraceae bacterium]